MLQKSDPSAAYKAYDEVLQEAKRHKIADTQFAETLASAEANRSALGKNIRVKIQAEEAEKERRADGEAAEKKRKADADTARRRKRKRCATHRRRTPPIELPSHRRPEPQPRRSRARNVRAEHLFFFGRLEVVHLLREGNARDRTVPCTFASIDFRPEERAAANWSARRSPQIGAWLRQWRRLR